MKLIAKLSLIVFAALLTLWLLGIVGFRYPVMVEGNALINPVRVRAIEDGKIQLEDGRFIQFNREETEMVKFRLEESAWMVEIGQSRTSEVEIFAGQTRNGYCGTPFAQPICIPLVRVEIPRHLKFLLCRGTIGQGKAKQLN